MASLYTTVAAISKSIPLGGQIFYYLFSHKLDSIDLFYIPWGYNYNAWLIDQSI